MIKIIAIIGEAGSGKDTLVKKLIQKSPEVFHEIISCTTRPKREKEIDGVDYYFLNENTFLSYQLAGHMLEYTTFRDWYYGTLLDSLNKEKINLGVFNPAGVRSLINHKDVNVIVYRLNVSPKERVARQLCRENNPDVDEIIRRYLTDKEDFSNLDFKFISVNNNTADDMRNLIKRISACGEEFLEQGEWPDKDKKS